MARPLLTVIEGTLPPRNRQYNPAKAGWSVLYRGSTTPCPGCARSNWWVGRQSAECAFCGSALPLAPFKPEEPTYG